jgi:hypothetical protein
VRRLEAGELLRELEVPPDGDLWEAAHRLLDLMPALLRADGFHPPRLSREKLTEAIEFLTVPPRDLQRVRLFRREVEDPLGTRQLVRVWTLGAGYVDAELEHAEEMLRHVAAVAQVELPAGVDVLVTPEMGRDVFPRQSGHPWAVGVYFLHDRYCAVRSRLPPLMREEVVKHELVHAYCHRFTEDFTSSCFVAEGLAEYLRRCRSSDDGFKLPASLFAGNLAHLQRMLRRSGFPLVRVPPRLLVRLPARAFYSLRSLGYLLAEAAMLYIGGDTIERAFRERRDDAIVAAVEAIGWRAFLKFVAKHADARATTLTVEDGSPEVSGSLSRRQLHETLAALGVKTPIDATKLVAAPGGLLEAPRQISAMLQALAEPGPAPVLFTDVSDAMDGGITLAEVPDSFRPFHDLRGGTGRDFVANLYALLRTLRPAASEPRLVALAKNEIAYPLDHRAPYSLAPFLEHWKADASEDRVVLCIASRGFNVRDVLHLPGGPPRPDTLPKVLLIIDLSDGSGDALPLARFLTCGPQYYGRAAYWNPQRR